MFWSQPLDRRNVYLVCTLLIAGWPLTGLRAQNDIVRIEEHWELAITQADSQTNAPQIMMHFSPFGAESDLHFELDLNHASAPAYAPGGLQVRAMDGNRVLSDVRLLDDNRLASNSEVLSWVQIAQKQPTGWAFAIGYGTSTSWGAFGGPPTVVTLPTGELPLNYSPEASLQNSGVIYAKNRVERLTLRKVRYYLNSNEYRDVTIDRSVP